MVVRFLDQSVYFIQSGDNGPIKIGVAQEPRTRLRQMQTGTPARLRLLGVTKGGPQREAQYHRYLAAHHLRGEWFNPAPQVLACVPGIAVERLQEALVAADVFEASAFLLRTVVGFKKSAAEVSRLSPQPGGVV